MPVYPGALRMADKTALAWAARLRPVQCAEAFPIQASDNAFVASVNGTVPGNNDSRWQLQNQHGALFHPSRGETSQMAVSGPSRFIPGAKGCSRQLSLDLGS